MSERHSRLRTARLSGMVLCCAGLLACGGGGATEADPGRPPAGEPIVVKVTVNNNIQPRTQVTIRLRSSGVTRILGSVSPGSERTFDIEDPTLTGRHNLTADGSTLAQSMTSQPFTLFANSWVVWTLTGNLLRVDTQLGVEP